MVDIGDRGVVTISSFSNQFIPASTPDVGDRVIVIPMNDGSKFCIPCLQFSIGDWVWVGPEFKFSGFNWKLDANLQLIPMTTKSWVQQTAGAEWAGRYGHGCVALSDGSIVLMGGLEQNDVWHSLDKGITWHQHTTGSPWWSGRSGVKSVVLSDDSIILVGGTFTQDVWKSTDAGESWTQQTATAGWSVRYQHSVCVMTDGSIVLTGGRYDTAKNDVWRSTDNGANWSLRNGGADWAGRSYHMTIGMPDGSIILIGGLNFGSVAFKDVWHSLDNGINWHQHTVVTAEFPTIYGSSIVIIPPNTIALIGGGIVSLTSGKVWISTDYGINWTVHPATTAWAPGDTQRVYPATVILPDDTLVLTGGYDNLLGAKNDVWRYP